MKRNHHNLRTWKKALDLVTEIYKVTDKFPKHELFAITSQMRRAAVSIPSNIAEGAARTSKREFLKFLSIARGSLSELETQVLISSKLGYLEDNTRIIQLIDHIFGLINGLMISIKRNNN